MAAILAFFLGVVTVIIIFISFWILSRESTKIRQVYDDVFCNSV
jgi:hypothetical protein